MYDEGMARKAAENLRKVRERKPLIHCITNSVTMTYTANALLACGASAVMAHGEEEVEEMVCLADALVLNLGTLTKARAASMAKAGKSAGKKRIPIVLDPVGVGATAFRTRCCRRFMEALPIRVIRGNASEILSLVQSGVRPKGVESAHPVDEATGAALKLARERGMTIAVSGRIDFVTDGKKVCRVYNGHTMMTRMTGAGCTATVMIAAFLAAVADPFEATAAALSYFGLAAEEAAQASEGPGSFQIRLLDALYGMKEEDLRLGAKIEVA